MPAFELMGGDSGVIIRVAQRRRYTAISNVPIEDDRLSWEAPGLLAWLLTKPNDWNVNREALIKCGSAGRDKWAGC